MNGIRPLMLLLAITVCNSAYAGILGGTQLEIDLTDADDAREKASWSPDSIDVTHDGLGWEGENNTHRDFWLMTKPIAVGTSWRPTTSASVGVRLSPEARGYKLPNGQQSYETVGQVFVRYSPDRQHWSSWQAVGFSPGAQQEAQKNASSTTGYSPFRRSYSTSLAVPRIARERYSKRLREFMRSDAVWTSDEEALARELVADDPDFFAKEQPYIGYVQVLYEGSLSGGLRLKQLNVDIGWAVGGIHSIPKDPAAQKDREGPWRFVAD